MRTGSQPRLRGNIRSPAGLHVTSVFVCGAWIKEAPHLSNLVMGQTIGQSCCCWTSQCDRALTIEASLPISVQVIEHRGQGILQTKEFVAIYALVNRIRLFASESVLEAAEAFVRKLVSRYNESNMSIDEMKTVALEQHVDPLNDFALKCRSELRRSWRRN